MISFWEQMSQVSHFLWLHSIFSLSHFHSLPPYLCLPLFSSLPQYLFSSLFLSPSLPPLSLPPSLFSCLFCLPIYPSVLYPLHLLSSYLSLSIFSPSPPLFLSLPRSSLYLIFLPPYFFSFLFTSLYPYLSIPLSLSLTLFCISSFTLSSYSSCLLYLSPLSLSIPPSLFYRYPRCL